MFVIDTSVWVDIFLPKNKNRSKLAEILLENISGPIFEPKIFVVELTSLVKRLAKKEIPQEFFNSLIILEEDEIFDTALDIAKRIHPRAVDSYFIATAKVTNSILISNDRIMVNNAKKYGIKAFYLIEELNKVLEEIKKMRE